MGKFTLVLLLVSLFAVGLAIPNFSQSNTIQDDAASSNSDWAVISSIRSAAGYFYDRFIDCSGTNTTPTTTTTTTTTTTRTPCNCGFTSRQMLRIVGGDLARHPDEFPWQVYIPASFSRCAGALIHEQWVLSSASCLSLVNISAPVTVKAGIRSYKDTSGQNTTGTVYIHPNFTMPSFTQQEFPFENDIALIKLAAPFINMSSVQSICLPINEVNNSLATYQVNVAGWGDNGFYNDTLSYASFSVLPGSSTSCPVSVLSYTNKTLCLNTAGTKGPCNHDGGAPVTWYDPIYRRAKLVGINGGNVLACGNPPIAVTRVSSYLSWITNTTGQTFCTPF